MKLGFFSTMEQSVLDSKNVDFYYLFKEHSVVAYFLPDASITLVKMS